MGFARPLRSFAGTAAVLLAVILATTTASAQAPAATPAPKAEAPFVAHEARREYERGFLWFGGRDIHDIGKGVTLAGARGPRRGMSTVPIEWEDFYLAVERPDLAREFVTRTRYRRGFVAGGIAGLAVGLSFFYGGLLFSEDDAGEDDHASEFDLFSDKGARYAMAGGVIAAGGSISLLVGLFTRRYPIARSEARQLAEEHNARLRARLGLPDQLPFTPGAPIRKQRFEITLSPVVHQRAGSLGATLRF